MIIPIIAGVLTTLLTAWAVSYFNFLTNANIQGFSVFIIVPIGAMLVGALAVSGMYIVRKLLKLEFKFAYLFIALFLGAVAFAGTIYFDYKNSIAAVVKELGGSLNEEQVKQFEKYYTFNQYLDTVYKKTTISISSRRGRKKTDIKNETVSMISFWASVIGSMAGGFIVHKLAVNSRIRRGSYYLDSKYFQNTNADNYQNIKDMIEQGKFGDELIRTVEDNKVRANVEHRVEVRVMKDRHKGDGVFSCQLISGTGNQQKIVERSDKELTPDQTEKIMMAVLSVNPKEKF